MVLKRDYLSGGAVEKSAYRDLQTRGEAALLAGRDLAIASWSRVLVEPVITLNGTAKRIAL